MVKHRIRVFVEESQSGSPVRTLFDAWVSASEYDSLRDELHDAWAVAMELEVEQNECVDRPGASHWQCEKTIDGEWFANIRRCQICGDIYGNRGRPSSAVDRCCNRCA